MTTNNFAKLSQDLDRFIADALHKSQAGLASSGGNPISNIAARVLGADPSKVDPFTKGFQEHMGELAGIRAGGSKRMAEMTSHLPSMLGMAGGAALVNYLYNNWKSNASSDAVLADPELSGKHPEHKIREALKTVKNYAPSLSHDPTYTRDQVKRLLNFEGTTPKDINEFLDNQKRYQEAVGGQAVISPLFEAAKVMFK